MCLVCTASLGLHISAHQNHLDTPGTPHQFYLNKPDFFLKLKKKQKSPGNLTTQILGRHPNDPNAVGPRAGPVHLAF